MRVLLIDPPFYRFMGYYSRYLPYGLASVATALQRSGHDVCVLNADQDPRAPQVDFSNLPEHYPTYLRGVADTRHPLWTELREQIDRWQPDVVGLTCLTPKVASVVRTAQLVKAWRPHCVTIAGGPHATARPRELLAVAPEIDIVVVGEGEDLAEHALSEIQTGGALPGPVLGPSPPVPAEMLGAIDREVLAQRTGFSSEDMGLMMTSRGCPYACAYCFSETMWGRTVRRRGVEDVVEEMRAVADRWGTCQFTFKDDCFTLHRPWVLDFCEQLCRLGAGWTWDCCTRIDLLDGRLLAVMRRAGCNSMKVGLESGSSRILELMGRGHDPAMMIDAARMLRSSGIHWTGYFMIGLPGETAEDVGATLELMEKTRPDFASLSTYEPLPGTRLFELARRSGDVRESMGREDFFHTLPNRYYLTEPACSGLAAMDCVQFSRLERDVKRRVGRYNRSPLRLARRGWARRRMYAREPALLAADAKRALAYVRSLGRG